MQQWLVTNQIRTATDKNKITGFDMR